VFGPMYGNAIMDWSNYVILSRCNAASSFPEVMQDQVQFSMEPFGDSQFGEMFSKGMPLTKIEEFKDRWLKSVVSSVADLGDIWVAIDGSNSDCDMQDGELPAHGKAKSRGDGPVVGYMYAVATNTNLPLTFDVFRGNVPDQKALMLMVNRLRRCGLKVKGAILDRIFCEGPALKAVESLGWEWVVMLKKNTNAHLSMMSHASEIRWNLSHVINGRGVFGTVGREPLFRSSDRACCVGLFFDGPNASDRSVRLIERVFDAEEDVRRQVERGEVPPVVADEARKYLSVKEVDGKWVTERNVEAWQSDLDAKGYCSIASSEDMTADELYGTYYMRDACEKAYSTMGSQLGSDVTRVHSDDSIHAKHLCTFVAQIIRSVVMDACRTYRLDTGVMIREMAKLHMSLTDDVNYGFVHNESVRQRKVLKFLGFSAEDLDVLTTDVNRRRNEKVVSQVHRMPENIDVHARRPTGREAKKLQDIANGLRPATEEPKPKGKPGRPKGSTNKNKKPVDNPVEKKRPGRRTA